MGWLKDVREKRQGCLLGFRPEQLEGEVHFPETPAGSGTRLRLGTRVGWGKEIRSSVLRMLSLRFQLDVQVEMVSRTLDM